MSVPDKNGQEDASRVDDALGEYMLRADAGEQIDREAFIAEHPDVAEELRAYFEDMDAIGEMVGTPVARGDEPAGPRPLDVIRYFGDYELLEEVGRGAMGVVYKARQRSLDRTVAVKMILAGELASQSEVNRFHREAEAAANLKHPSIIAIYEVGEHQGQHFFSMEYVEGQNLSALVRHSPLPCKKAAQYMQQVAEAVQHAHEQGTLHRDLKPSNILIDTDDRPHVTDFGLAKRVKDSALTRSGMVLGSLSYMPPEQAEGRINDIDRASDVYSLGATLYELVTDRPPFWATSLAETVTRVKEKEPISPRVLNPAVDRDIETICLKCLEKSASQRYPSAAELAEELGRFLRGEPIQARPISKVARTWRWCKRNPVVSALLAAFVLALVAGTATSTYFAVEANRRAARLEQVADSAWQSALQNVQFAAEGQLWHTALSNYDEALEAGYADTTSVRLGKLDAWFALNSIENVRSEVEDLAKLEDLGERRGRVLLWQAEVALLDGDHDQATQYAKEAVDAGLPPADLEYARGLVADNSMEAVAHFTKALERASFHQRASTRLVVHLLLLGKLDEASARLAAISQLVPREPNVIVLQGIVDSLRGEVEFAKARLNESHDIFSMRQTRAFSDVFESLQVFGEYVGDWDQGDGVNDPVKFIGLGREIESACLLGNKGESEPHATITLRFPYSLKTNFFGTSLAYATSMVAGNYGLSAARLEAASKQHPEGTVFFVLGNLYVADGRWKEAENAFLRCINNPSVSRGVQREAYFGAAMAQISLVVKGQEDKLTLAVQNVQERVTLGPMQPLHAYYSSLIAMRARDYGLARYLLTDALRRSPESQMLKNGLVKLLLVQGERGFKEIDGDLEQLMQAASYGDALRKAEELLRDAPTNKQLANYRADANEKLREVIEKYDILGSDSKPLSSNAK